MKKESAKEKKPVIRPVRRRLMAAAMAYLCGIFLTQIVILPPQYAGAFCAFALVWAAWRLCRRKSAFFCMIAWMLSFGHLRAGAALLAGDIPTAPGAAIEGTVSAIKKDYRVYLTDVTVEGEMGPKRDVVATLMLEDEEGAAVATSPLVGQRVSGVGRLFAPDEKRNPGGIDGRIQAICDGYELSGYLLPGWTVCGEPVFSLREWFRGLRERILAHTGALFGEQAALFQGIMLGDRSGLDSETAAAMRLTGTAHILTVSGLHLSMIARLVSRGLNRAPIRRRGRFAILGAFLAFFTCLTGAAAGTIRACIMALLREYAVVRGRRYEPLTGLACAALLMTLVMPLWALNASFQFSFFVVLGIQLFSRSFSDFANRHARAGGAVRSVLGMAAVSASAQIAAVPMQLLLYGYVPLLSLPMNLFCGALMPALLLGGWGTALLGMVWTEAGLLPARALAYLAAGFEQISLKAAALDGAIVRLPAPYGVSVLLFLLLMLLLSPRIRYGRMRKMAVCAAAGLMALSYLPRLNPQARYVQLDVGQGDAALFRRGRRAVLVDVGPADSYDMLRYLRHEGLLVDAVILSHMDEDHAGALGTLLASEVEIPAVIMAERAAQEEDVSKEVQAALERMAQEGTPLREVERGDQISVNGLTIDVLSPSDALSGSNERSLLLHAELADVSFLLTGDLPADSEPEAVPACDVLKTAHHGSRNSTSDAFLENAQPRLALISVGAGNRYGHPHERVLSSLERAGAQTLRTDEAGCITLWLDEGTFKAQTYLKQAK